MIPSPKQQAAVVGGTKQPLVDQGEAANKAVGALEQLTLMAASIKSDDENAALSFSPAGIGQSREQRIIRLTEQNKTYRERIAQQEAALQQEAEHVKGLERGLERSRATESSLKTDLQRRGQQLAKIRETLTKTKDSLDRNITPPLIRGVKREFVEGAIEQLINIASDTSN